MRMCTKKREWLKSLFGLGKETLPQSAQCPYSDLVVPLPTFLLLFSCGKVLPLFLLIDDLASRYGLQLVKALNPLFP